MRQIYLCDIRRYLIPNNYALPQRCRPQKRAQNCFIRVQAGISRRLFDVYETAKLSGIHTVH